ncbi:MAG: glutamine synthetase type III, partial [Elusimicrobiota bacterium]
QTGRTLFGKTPAKHQQMDDHYFGAIKQRVINFMEEVDEELWKLGIPARTRHNEVCPAQFELAPVYEELNLSVDHNMLTMQVMKEIAEKHGFICLLHEKPFAGVNGSGKHINWSIQGPDGRNWLNPGDNPHENAKFLTIICTLMKAIDTHAGLLRASVASAGNDHRLGANEAPPAILSIFLGDQLTDIIKQIETGGTKSSKEGEVMELGITSLPNFIKDVTDRNRTSPFAFTGNKFEFRAPGASQSCASPALILNTIVADALDKICTRIEEKLEDGENLNHVLQEVLQDVVKKHKRILFNGNSYTSRWKKEAKKRGLPNLETTEEALQEYKKEDTVELFERHNILSREELFSRYEIYKEQYGGIVQIEAKVSLDIAKTLILPAVSEYRNNLSSDLTSVKNNNLESSNSQEFLKNINGKVENLLDSITKLEKALESDENSVILKKMKNLRSVVDDLEAVVSADLWPLPSYTDMMFLT